MEMEEMQLSKRSRVGNGVGYEAPKPQQQQQLLQQQQSRQVREDDGDGDASKARLRAWQNHASRICRVSRASGGKDRHSKVLTAKGLRDRRVRLSVSTAIQFYDLQDRLGYDQPSKAVEWLIKAASAAIGELPSLDAAFPDLESQLMGFKHRGGDSGPGRRRDEDEEDAEKDEEALPHHQRQQHLSLEKSACSSTSETSKGSVLSLSRSESRVKARERAKERMTSARDKEKSEQDDAHNISDSSFHQSMNHDHNPHASFTDLLTGGGSVNHNPVTVAHANSSAPGAGIATPGFMHKQILHFPHTATTDYFGQAAATLGQVHKPHHSSGYPSQPHFLHNSSTMAIVPFNVTTAVAAAGSTDNSDFQLLPFVQDQSIPIAAVAPGGDYNLNFSISSGLAGFNRGTLQSNSPSSLTHIHHLQRLPSTMDGSNLPFFFGVAGATTTHATTNSADNQFPTGFDGRLQFCYLDIKGKDKS